MLARQTKIKSEDKHVIDSKEIPFISMFLNILGTSNHMKNAVIVAVTDTVMGYIVYVVIVMPNIGREHEISLKHGFFYTFTTWKISVLRKCL